MSKNKFTSDDADQWFRRNQHKLGVGRDLVMEAIVACNIKPRQVLEIGCANGWRLNRIKQAYCPDLCWGLDYSPVAINDGQERFKNIFLEMGTAGTPTPTGFDLVIAGFFLYLAQREDLFDIAMHLDAKVADGGHLIIHDFFPTEPHSRTYIHRPELRSYKQDYSRMFTWNPAYKVVEYFAPSCPDEDGVMVLRKDLSNAWPLR